MLGALQSHSNQVNIVGGGIAGLMTAYFLDQRGFEVTLYEASHRWGGLIQTQDTPWGIAESAAHSLLVNPEVRCFFDALQVPLEAVQPQSKARYILRQGQLRRFPLNMKETFEMVKKMVWGHIQSSQNEITLQDWAEQCLGQGACRYLITPMSRGIFGLEPKSLMLKAAFPMLQVPAGQSLLGFQIRKAFQHFKKSSNHPQIEKSLKKGRSQMMAPAGGMGTFVSVLQHYLQHRLKHRMFLKDRIQPFQERPKGNWVIATSAHDAGNLLQCLEPRLSEALLRVQYVPLVCTTIFLEKSSFSVPPCGVGVLMPEGEPVSCLGILFNSSAFPGRVVDPDRWVSLTVMMGGFQQATWLDQPDEIILKQIQYDLEYCFRFRGKVQHAVIHRWKKAIPCYDRYLWSLWQSAQLRLCENPGIVLMGNYTRSVSLRGMIETLIHQGKNASIELGS